MMPLTAVLGVGDDKTATIKGQVEFDKDFLVAWNGTGLNIPFAEIPTKLYQQVEIPTEPLPESWNEMNIQQRQEWWNEFVESDEGKRYMAERQSAIDAAKDFDVILGSNGRFVVYDVPVGVYGLRGLVDKEIQGVVYRYEIFGQLEVVDGMDELNLNPIQVAITPLLNSGMQAPPIAVNSHDNSQVITLDSFEGKYRLICFWISNSPSAEFQSKVQETYSSLKDKYPLRLLSVCVDQERSHGLKFIIDQKLSNGKHGFTDGFEHRTLFDYGVRAIPSFWLIDPEGKIALSQVEFSQAFFVGNDLSTILTHRLEGKPIPNLPTEEQNGITSSDSP